MTADKAAARSHAPRPPAAAGMHLRDVDTPALLLDLDAFERNLQRMSRFARANGVALRPHAKSHKSDIIALRQVALGAVGVCCQKVSEAEALIAGGVQDVLVSNQIVGAQKIERLLELTRLAHVAVCVDDAENVGALSAASRQHGATLDVLVEIEVGGNRCGVAPGAAALRLARAIDDAPGLRFAGLQAYNGAAQHVHDARGRAEASAQVIELTRQARDLLRMNGLACGVITGAGTGSYPHEASSGVFNELQPGSYVFMDAAYARNRADGDGPISDFEQSLFVLTTVMSRANHALAIVDAGLKAVGVDAGMPRVELPGAEYAKASDEHGVLRLAPGAEGPCCGSKLRLVAGNCDPTVNLHDWYVVFRGERVEALWPVAARGPGF